jgi:hypothetical protein
MIHFWGERGTPSQHSADMSNQHKQGRAAFFLVMKFSRKLEIVEVKKMTDKQFLRVFLIIYDRENKKPVP